MRIAIAIAITLTLAATLAPLQQARGWAATCADGNTDVCCHLERLGWDVYTTKDLSFIRVEIASQLLWPEQPCTPLIQRMFDRTIPLMCETDCWGGAIALDGEPSKMPTQAAVLTTQCTVTHFVNATCPPPAAPTPTPISSTASSTASPTESSSTAPATESSSSSSTGTDANAQSASSAALGPADEDSIGAAAPQMHSHWAFALAFALVLWH